MTLWTIYVISWDMNTIEIEIDSESTFLEFRKKVADKIPGVRWEDLILASKKDYDLNYNSKKMSEIDQFDIYDQCTLMAVFAVNGGNDTNSLICNK